MCSEFRADYLILTGFSTWLCLQYCPLLVYELGGGSKDFFYGFLFFDNYIIIICWV